MSDVSSACLLSNLWKTFKSAENIPPQTELQINHLILDAANGTAEFMVSAIHVRNTYNIIHLNEQTSIVLPMQTTAMNNEMILLPDLYSSSTAAQSK